MLRITITASASFVLSVTYLYTRLLYVLHVQINYTWLPLLLRVNDLTHQIGDLCTLELPTGIEPVTSSLPWKHSTY